jgi:hypothetical protein
MRPQPLKQPAMRALSEQVQILFADMAHVVAHRHPGGDRTRTDADRGGTAERKARASVTRVIQMDHCEAND